jgi:nucleoside-diphosphate-sugar epimerase
VNPSYFIGPNAPGQIVAPGDLNALSTNLKLYNILFPDTKDTTPFGFVDVRDVARGLVAGIKAPGRNRVLLSGEWFDYADAIDYLSSVRPELLPRLGTATRVAQKDSLVDDSRAYEILGIPPVTPWKTSVIDTVNILIQVEKDWEEAGIDVENTLKKSNRRA